VTVFVEQLAEAVGRVKWPVAKMEPSPASIVGVGMTETPVASANPLAGSRHDVKSWIVVSKMLTSVLKEFKSARNPGNSSSAATSKETVTLASTRTRDPIAVSRSDSAALGSLMLVVFGDVISVDSRALQFASLFDKRRSRRGNSIFTVIPAFSWSRNSKPMGMDGRYAALRRMSKELMLAVNGRGTSLESGKPTMLLFVKSTSSTLIVDGLGT
jgi:hypothetical protein